MKSYQVTMVNPQQIVSKGLKGCSTTRTVMSFAQKYGVPSVWWSPNRNQKVLLVDWPKFRTTWNQVWSGHWTEPMNFKGTYSRTNYRGTNSKGTGSKGTNSKGTWSFKTPGYKGNTNYTSNSRGTTTRRNPCKTTMRNSNNPTTRRTTYRYTKRTGRAA